MLVSALSFGEQPGMLATDRMAYTQTRLSYASVAVCIGTYSMCNESLYDILNRPVC